MNKAELIDHVAATAGVDISKAAVGRVVDATFDAVEQALKKGEDVTLVGFGTLGVRKHAARKGRNPQTGAEIHIKERKAVFFRAGKALKDAVNSKK